ncbi:MAG: hypothetical protein C0619_11610 [Desulfuromonas sp.]|nr:MAG: hypothetical protein C0619_11610 [Desulfuromonas sp.]
MRNSGLVFLFVLLFFVDSQAGETLQISSRLSLHYDLPNGWVSAAEPPQFLVDEMAEHMEHEAAAKGRHPNRKQLESAARKRYSENEVLLYNPQSYAHMSLDFSQLRQGEKPPSRDTIKLSTRYAAESLRNEEGVTDLRSTDTPIEISGAWYAHRFDSHYKHHDKTMDFIGVVGFSSSYWFYFYFTDFERDEQDRKRAETFLSTIRIDTAPQ